ncbi:MAG: penicillin-binding protein 1A [Xanthomonadales bacterium]|nr:penicillin-binding protein 1A [Xanthomonadales bacterium]
MPPVVRRLLKWAVLACAALVLIGGLVFAALYISVSRDLPDVTTLRDVQLQQPMSVYSADGKLMAVFGESRRIPVDITKVPQQVKDAFIATEDADFYKHGGLDYKGIARAIWLMATTSDKRVPGGSTITQQVARQFFLTPERSFKRKFREMLLARRIEQNLSKDQILELYLNKSFFGNRSYGIAAAAQYYYGKPLDQLTLGETATLAGTPKFPSTGNPMDDPDRNHDRRNNYILPRMVQLGMVSQAAADAAAAEPMHAAPHERPVEVYAPYVAEMVRQEMLTRYGPRAQEQGYEVTTTIDSKMQLAADVAVRHGLRTYDHRHGWRGPEKHFDLPAGETPEQTAKRLAPFPVQAALVPVIVLSTEGNGSAQVVDAQGKVMTLPASLAASWPGRAPASLFKRGDIARITDTKDNGWAIEQLPRAQSALVSIDYDNGALKALIGGLSFNGNSFNRATQARRQPGSSFKPFVYAAAFERGYNPSSIVLDAPVVFRDRANHIWRPQNDGGGFAGPIKLREALVQSRNLVSVRLLDAIGVDYAIRFITHFGFNEKELPRNLSMSLGAASLRPIDMARGYAAFANGGFRVDVWFIDTVKDGSGKQLFKANPVTACRGCAGTSLAPSTVADTQAAAKPQQPDVVDGFNLGGPQAEKPKPAVAAKSGGAKDAPKPALLPEGSAIAPRAIDERIAYQLVTMMQDVVKRGTATAARVLDREDIGGKTGSTNDHRDAWFSGFGGKLVTVVWVGRDDDDSLGYGEYGGKAALPIWIDYMRDAIKDQPQVKREVPNGMVQVNGEWLKEEDLQNNPDIVDYSQAPKDDQTQQEAPKEDAYDIF